MKYGVHKGEYSRNISIKFMAISLRISADVTMVANLCVRRSVLCITAVVVLTLDVIFIYAASMITCQI
jgi:hypothetical protein